MRPRMRDYCFQPDLLFTRVLVATFYVWTTTNWSSSKLVPSFFSCSFIKSLLPSKKFTWSSYFLSFFFISLDLFVGLWEPGSLCELQDLYFQTPFQVCINTCLYDSSLNILHEFQINLYQHFSHVCSISQTEVKKLFIIAAWITYNSLQGIFTTIIGFVTWPHSSVPSLL